MVRFVAGKDRNVSRLSLYRPLHFEGWKVKVQGQVTKIPKSFWPLTAPGMIRFTFEHRPKYANSEGGGQDASCAACRTYSGTADFLSFVRFSCQSASAKAGGVVIVASLILSLWNLCEQSKWRRRPNMVGMDNVDPLEVIIWGHWKCLAIWSVIVRSCNAIPLVIRTWSVLFSLN